MPHTLLPEGLCRLDDRGVIRALGADAATFLQGQLTNDVLGLGEGEARLAGFCSAKGRLQASFIVWRAAPDEFLLACAADLLAPTLKRLSMFVMRAKCKLSDASAEIGLWGVAGSDAFPPLPLAGEGRGEGLTRQQVDDITAIHLPDAGVPRLLIAAAALPTSLNAVPTIALADWNALDIRSGVVTIEAATIDRFVPQMVNFELLGGVDFKKGCYPGQEVVARSQYRSTAKRRTFLFESDGIAVAGQDVFLTGSSGEPAGTVANAAPRPYGSVALVEVRLTALDGELRLGSGEGPGLRRIDLPYAVAIESEATA